MRQSRVFVCLCRTARDAGVHLSKAGVSFLGEQGFCLVDGLPRLMDSTADAGHRHLRVGGRGYEERRMMLGMNSLEHKQSTPHVKQMSHTLGFRPNSSRVNKQGQIFAK